MMSSKPFQFAALALVGALATAATAADGVRVRVVAGVNVPMLWRSLCYVGVQLDDLVARAVDGGTNGVMHVPPENKRQNQSKLPSSNDQDDDPHQQ